MSASNVQSAGGRAPSQRRRDYLIQELRTICKGRVCVVGVGNRLKGDDGAGPLLIDRVRDTIAADCLDTGVAPENYLGRIAGFGPDTVLMVDAVALDERPGTVQVFSAADIAGGGLSTHAGSLAMVAEYLTAQTGCRVFLAGIVPEETELGLGVSPAVAEAVDILAASLLDVVGVRNPRGRETP